MTPYRHAIIAPDGRILDHWISYLAVTHPDIRDEARRAIELYPDARWIIVRKTRRKP